jgi:hypothetical protein
MPRCWCLGVAAIVSTAIGASPAGAQQPPVPDVPTPTVTVPQPSVPPVTVPEVTVPPAPTPVPTPTVTTPSVTVPSVSGSSSGSGSSDSGAASGSGSSAISGSGGGSGSGSSAASGSGSGSSATSGSGAASGSDSGTASGERSGASAPARPRASSTGDEPGAAAKTAQRRDRELRRTVLGHDGCLGRMPRAERRVLTLRAGVGIDRTRSRAEVARLTGLKRVRVGALERRGMARLRALVDAGACAAGGSAPSEVSAGGARDRGASTPRTAVHGQREFSVAQPPRASAAESPARDDDGRPLLHTPDSARDFAPVLAALALAALVFVLAREARRSA